MGFRSDKDANRYRVDALEEELEEKDAELERLRAEVAKRDADAKRDAKGKAKSKRAKRSKPKRRRKDEPPVQDVPTGDRWTVRTFNPLWLLLPGAAAVGVCLAALGVGASSGQPTPRWLVMLLPAGLLALVLSQKIVLDRRQGRVSKTWGPLRVPMQGDAFRVREFITSSENGPSVYWGRVCYGKHRLLAKRKGEAIVLARRMAAFMDAAYEGSAFNEKEQERVALGPLLGTFGLSALIGAVLGLAYLLGLYHP